MCWTLLSTVCGLVERDIMKSTFPVPNNPAKNERSALAQLMNDDHLIIKPAHIVVQDSQKM